MFNPLGFLRLSEESLPGAYVPFFYYSLDLVTVPKLRLIGISSISYLPPEISTFPNPENPYLLGADELQFFLFSASAF